MSLCLSVWMYVCNTITFEALTFISAYEGIRVKLVYEGHRVKVKVTGAKDVENPHSRNVQLPSAIIHVPYPWSLRAAWGFRLWRIEWCNRVTWPDAQVYKRTYLRVAGFKAVTHYPCSRAVNTCLKWHLCSRPVKNTCAWCVPAFRLESDLVHLHVMLYVRVLCKFCYMFPTSFGRTTYVSKFIRLPCRIIQRFHGVCKHDDECLYTTVNGRPYNGDE